MARTILPAVAETDWRAIDEHVLDNVWLRVNLRLIERDLDTLIDALVNTDDLSARAELGHALDILGAMWHRCARHLEAAGYPHPDDTGRLCDTEGCRACNGESE